MAAPENGAELSLSRKFASCWENLPSSLYYLDVALFLGDIKLLKKDQQLYLSTWERYDDETNEIVQANNNLVRDQI